MTERVTIIGAGAAGIGAARVLSGAGVPVLLIESNDRIGGRAWTVERDGIALDLGCSYLHSADRNPWATLAQATGFSVDHSDPGWHRQYRDLGFPPAEREAAHAALDAFQERLPHLATDNCADAFEPGNPWNAYLQALSGYISGDPFERVSARDYLAYDAASTNANWRVREGYGALIASALPAAVELRIGVTATRIDHAGRALRIETDVGTIETNAAIVAVPTAALAEERLRFHPPLPAKREAAAGLPLGLADKLFFRLDTPGLVEADQHVLGNPRSADTASYQLRPLGQPIVEAFVGGDLARALERESDAAAYGFALDELAALFGGDIRRHLTPIARSRWARWSGGSYSHALPGRAGARTVLAEPVDGRLFFAGEACSAGDFSTAHGALATGEQAALDLLARRRDTRRLHNRG
jgi:monoamine oxidase